jgi:hypothetical protein
MENSTLQKSFYSKNNIGTLQAWVTEQFVTKKGYNIDAVDLKPSIINYMEKAYVNKDTFIPLKMHPKQKLLNLNKKVVQIANNELPTMIETFICEQKDKVSNIQRVYDLPDTKERVLLSRPDDQNLLKRTKSNVENRYQELSNEREIKKPTSAPIFEDDSVKTYDDTSNLYDKIMDMRNNDDKVVAFEEEDKAKPCFIPYEVEDGGTLLDNIDGKVKTNDHCNPFENSSREKVVLEKKKVKMDTIIPKNMKDDYSLVNDRNDDETFIKNQFCDNDPKDLYKDVLSKSKIDTMVPTPRTTEIDYLTKPDMSNKNIVNLEVIINASDRNWNGFWDANDNSTHRL